MLTGAQGTESSFSLNSLQLEEFFSIKDHFKHFHVDSNKPHISFYSLIMKSTQILRN